MDGRETASFRRRTRWVLTFFLCGLAVVAVRAAQLQLFEGQRYARMSRQEYLKDVQVPARRGHIFDRNGRPLASSLDVPSVWADPTAVVDARAAARQLSKILDLELDPLYQKLASDRLFVWLKRRVPLEVAKRVEALGLTGVALTREPKRFYPNDEIAAHVIGFAGLDGRGLEGMERLLDEDLRGEPQAVVALRDARRNTLLESGLDPNQNAVGADVTLTIDVEIQHAAQRALARVVKERRALGAMSVVLDVQGSEVLALAVEPSFNPNNAAAVSAETRRNRVLTDMFEPGSTFKPLVVAAALDTKAVGANATFFCENGAMRIDGYTIRDTSPKGWLDVQNIIAKSSNIGAAKIGQALGRERLYAALTRYGFGARTGSGFPGEAAGMLRPAAAWSDIGLATISFGHGIAVTAMQLAAAYRVLAAGGVYQAPTLVRRIVRPDGSATALPRPQPHAVVAAAVVRRVTRMMEAVVSAEGTGGRAAVPGYRVAGKTGTAQKIDAVAGGYSDSRFVASFAGFLPAEAPRVVVVVAVDEPQEEHTGGAVAAPVFAEIAKAAMQYLGVVPTEAPALAAVPLLSSGEVASAAVARDEPASVISAAEGGLEAPGLIPSFLGLSPRQVAQRFVESQLQLTLEMEGSGRVIKQQPTPGSNRKDATRMHLVLAQP